MQHTSAVLPRAEGAHVRRAAVELPCREDPLRCEEQFEPTGAGPHVLFAGSRHSGFGPRERVRTARDFRTGTATVYAHGSRTVIR